MSIIKRNDKKRSTSNEKICVILSGNGGKLQGGKLLEDGGQTSHGMERETPQKPEKNTRRKTTNFQKKIALTPHSTKIRRFSVETSHAAVLSIHIVICTETVEHRVPASKQQQHRTFMQK